MSLLAVCVSPFLFMSDSPFGYLCMWGGGGECVFEIYCSYVYGSSRGGSPINYISILFEGPNYLAILSVAGIYQDPLVKHYSSDVLGSVRRIMNLE